MPTPSNPPNQKAYDPRWFIWSIVFLVVTGVSLTAYIALSGDNSADASALAVVHHKSLKK